MAKYLIQDIIPSNKKRTTKTVESGTTVKNSASVHSEITDTHHEDHPIKATVSHALHHEQQLIEQAEPEIHDEIIERPQSLIIENLYHNDERNSPSIQEDTSKPLTEINSGSYPYNSVSGVEERTPNASPVWKFPERSHVTDKLGGWVPWILIPIVLLVGGVLLMNHFAGATVLLIPKHDTLPIPQGETFTAVKNPSDTELGFSVMKITLDDKREVSATGTKTVTAKASGKIIVYNEQTAPQRLIKNTRFESTAGKIYRINDSVNIPKATIKNGKTVPGSLEVVAYGDEAGPDFNTVPTDFSIPGLKNTPQSKKVYGRSNGPMTGGASGTVKSVSDQELKQAGEDLRVSLETKLRSKARSDLAPNQIAYDQGIVLSLDDPKLSTTEASSGDKAVVVESGTIYMIIFDRDALTKAVTKGLVPTYNGESIEMTNIESLNMVIPAQKGDTLATLDRLDFTLSGTPSLIWQIDKNKIKKELQGVQKSNFNLILSQYSNIERAKASIQPIWKSTFPSDENLIDIKLVNEIPN